MKLALVAASAAAVLVLGSQTASAQPVIVQPAYSPGITIGGTFYGRGGVAIGGAYTTGPTVVAAPGVYAGPVYAPPPPVVVRPAVVVAPPVVTIAPFGYARPYYAPYGYHHGYRRW